jgi:NAD(P) transhydrogenase
MGDLTDATAKARWHLETMIGTATGYDLIAIGSGPAGQRAAVQAAKLGKRVAVIERENVLGGASTNTGTVPSKTLRAVIVELAGQARGGYKNAGSNFRERALDDLHWRTHEVVEHEREVIFDQLRRNNVDLYTGVASFVDPYTIQVGDRLLSAERYVIAVGTTPARPEGVDFDDSTVLDSDGILRLRRLPATMTVIGGGVIGLEYASMAAALGVHVTLVEKREHLLEFVDAELVEALQYHLRGVGLVLRLGEEVETVRRPKSGGAVTHLRSGKLLPSEVVLYAAGRQGAVSDLNLAAAGLEADARGRISVGPDYRTAQPHIFAAGDVIGFPSLAATSLDQGRLAALAAFDQPARTLDGLIPYGIYTIPELSYVGRNERELTHDSVPYVVGISRYRELARGAIAGDRSGLLKLLVHAESRQLLGVHIFGTSAAELVHVGQTAMAGELPVDYLVDAVFNVPTFGDAYKVAALDAADRLNELDSDRTLAA